MVGAAAVIGCSGVDDYPVSGHGGQQTADAQGGANNGNANGGASNGGASNGNASGGTSSANGGTTNTNGSATGNGNGGSNNSGGMSFGQGGNAKGGAANGGTSFGAGGMTASKGGGTSSGGGTSTGTGGGTSTTVSFSQVQTIVNRSCGATGCHSSGGQAPNLSSTGSTLYGTLTGTSVRECSNNKLVAASNPSSSALVGLITGKCTLRMPLGCTSSPCLSQADTDTLSNWITQGAKQQ